MELNPPHMLQCAASAGTHVVLRLLVTVQCWLQQVARLLGRLLLC